MRRNETVGNADSFRGSNTDGKEVVRSLVDKIPDNILERTRVRKRKVAFKEEAEHLGLGQESGEWSIFTEDHPIISHLTTSLWFRSMDLTITSSTSKSRGPSNERKDVDASEKQLESMVYRLTQERGRWPLLAKSRSCEADPEIS